MIEKIVSKRGIDARAFFDICYEWEDILSKEWNVPVKSISKISYPFRRVKGKLFPYSYKIKQRLDKPISVYFVMFVSELKYYSRYNGIPIFIDVWGDEQIHFIIKKMEGVSLYYVTSLDVYNQIKEVDVNNPVKYMPLSVSDIYFSMKFKKKSNRVIQMGRKNCYLHEWMLRYVSEHPQVEYIYTQNTTEDGKIEYISSQRGNIGSLKDRKEFIKILGTSKVSLVSSPAIDASRGVAVGKGIDYPTPRFYESAVLGCALIGRYTKNEEFILREIGRICPCVESYKEFAQEMTMALKKNEEQIIKENREFIIENLTSKRAEQIENDLEHMI